MSKNPVFFVSHGEPTFALEPRKLGDLLNALGRELSGVNAVLVVSPQNVAYSGSLIAIEQNEAMVS